MGHGLKFFLGLGAAAAAVLSFAAAAEAGVCKGRHCKGPRIGHEPGVYRYIYVESDFGHRSVAAPVRRGRWGDQVKIPGGGAWIDCEITCEYTLRRVSVDFWEDQRNGYTSPNYFRYDIDVDTGHVRRRFP
jgi:hypothetical protein